MLIRLRHQASEKQKVKDAEATQREALAAAADSCLAGVHSTVTVHWRLFREQEMRREEIVIDEESYCAHIRSVSGREMASTKRQRIEATGLLAPNRVCNRFTRARSEESEAWSIFREPMLPRNGGAASQRQAPEQPQTPRGSTRRQPPPAFSSAKASQRLSLHQTNMPAPSPVPRRPALAVSTNTPFTPIKAAGAAPPSSLFGTPRPKVSVLKASRIAAVPDEGEDIFADIFRL